MRAASASSASLPNVVLMQFGEAEMLILQGVHHLVNEDAALVVALDVVIKIERLFLDVVIALDALVLSLVRGITLALTGDLKTRPRISGDFLFESAQGLIEDFALFDGLGKCTEW